MEHGKLKREQFMREIVAMTRAHRRAGEELRKRHDPGRLRDAVDARCPKCGGEVHEKYKKFQCQSCDFGMWKIVAGRQLEIPEAEALLTDRERRSARRLPQQARPAVLGEARDSTTPTRCSSISATATGDGADGEAPDFSDQEPLGACPKCSSRVFELPRRTSARKRSGPDKTCDFRSGRIILQRPIERAQMQKLLATGKTDLAAVRLVAHAASLFAAYLVRQPDGKIGFEFEAERMPRGAPLRAARGAARAAGARQASRRTSSRSSCTRGRYGPVRQARRASTRRCRTGTRSMR